MRFILFSLVWPTFLIGAIRQNATVLDFLQKPFEPLQLPKDDRQGNEKIMALDAVYQERVQTRLAMKSADKPKNVWVRLEALAIVRKDT